MITRSPTSCVVIYISHSLFIGSKFWRLWVPNKRERDKRSYRLEGNFIEWFEGVYRPVSVY